MLPSASSVVVRRGHTRHLLVALLFVVTLGASFVILMGSIDLSVGANVLLVGTVTVAGLKQIPDVNPGLLVLPFGAVLGGLLGAFNGSISVIGKIPSFVVTLGSLSVFTGIALSILAGATIMFELPIFDVLSLRQSIPHLPNIALCALLLWLIFIFVGARTRFGRFALAHNSFHHLAHRDFRRDHGCYAGLCPRGG